MLLPSDVARLVLGYLQEEGLSATSQAFIHESPNLKEYADHTTADGTIPACLFSAFGKGLTTILNEYVATRTKESFPAVPAAMTSLWKKLDFTLNQIKSLQNTPAISACQRTRSRVGVANMTRQRVLTMASPAAIICSSVSETSSIISPALTSHSMLGHSTPVSYAALPGRPSPGSSSTQPQSQDVRLNAPRDSPAQIVVSEHRQTTGPMSPGRRKWDTPRKRGGAVSGSSNLAKCSTPATGISAEPQLEEAVDENFPQLVIQNARDKILGDRSLQEKLAENINKILGSDPVPQISKASSTVEADQSIDEILGLQGEIHMSDDAIHDILEQTESDPAFQALYDLFDYNKTRFPDGEEDLGSNAEQSDIAGPSSIVKPLLSEEPGPAQSDAVASDTPVTSPQKTRAGPERKARKTGTLLKKKAPGRSGRASRIEGSSARLLVSTEEPRPAPSSNSDRKEKSLDNGAFGTPMDVDEPLNTPPPPPPPPPSDSEAPLESTPGPPSLIEPEATPASGEERRPEPTPAQGSQGGVVQSDPPACLSTIQAESGSSPVPAVHLPHGAADVPGVFTAPATPQSACSASMTSTTPVTAAPGPATASSTSTTSTTPTASSPLTASSLAALGKAAADPGIVSLKIIISENQEEEPPGDPALSQAVSSMAKDQIPTIYISSPAKSLGGSSAPGASLDEAAQAVSGLQNSEIPSSPLCSKAGALVASPLSGTSQLQQNYIFQLPLDAAAAPAVQGATASYFLLTEPPATEPQTRPMLLPKGQPLATGQFGLPTAGQPQGYAAGSALILPSPLKPMVLPVSVMGQNTLGKVQMVSNQLVAIPNAVPLQQSETLKPITPKVAIQWPATAGTEQHPAGMLAQPVSAENAGQQDAANALRHKRILCFDSTAATGTSVPPATSASPSGQKPEKDNARAVTQTKPAILGGNKPKRRVQTVKCTADPLANNGFMKEPEKPLPPPPPPPKQQKDPARRTSRKQDHSIINTDLAPSGSSSEDASKPETLKTESKRRSRSASRKASRDKDGDEGKAKDSTGSNSSSDAATKSGAKKDKEESSRKEVTEKAVVKSCEGRAEKKAPSEETPNVTANKENEMKGSLQEQQLAPLSSPSRDFSPAASAQPASNTQPKAPKTPSKTSSLAKQAAVMLHDIQSLGSPSTPNKRPGPAGSDAPARTSGPDGVQEDPRPASADSPRTPSTRQKKGKDGEGTPKHLIPPNTPDVPTCSPASEAGSENSINMAAHTLMILSRAAIARTGTPLKDSLRQEGADKKLSPASKTSKKRKQASPTASPPAKKDRERKKLIDCFPHDLDVDKFLSSLHYDE